MGHKLPSFICWNQIACSNYGYKRDHNINHTHQVSKLHMYFTNYLGSEKYYYTKYHEIETCYLASTYATSPSPNTKTSCQENLFKSSKWLNSSITVILSFQPSSSLTGMEKEYTIARWFSSCNRDCQCQPIIHITNCCSRYFCFVHNIGNCMRLKTS